MSSDAELAEARLRLIEQEAALRRAEAERRRLLRGIADARADADAAEAERDALRRLLEDIARPAQGARSAPPAIVDPPSRWPALPAREIAAQETFASAYRDAGAEISLPCPADTRGVLVEQQNHPSEMPSVDVVVCVHNALEDVRRCLWSLVHKTGRPFRLIVVDDGSDRPTADFLDRLAANVPALTLLRNPDPPHGYTIAANIGLRATSADYAILLNSDTVVTFGWLEAIVARGEADPEIGILGPLSNAATHQSVPRLRGADGWSTNPLPPWLVPDAIALVARNGPPANARLPFINGFCYVIRRPVIEAIGDFDEECFASGYCEENDYSQRAREAGFATCVVEDSYVYHAKSRSFGSETRRIVAKRNYEVFLEKHGRERINGLVAQMEADHSLEGMRAAVAEATESPEAFAAAIAEDPIGPLEVAFVLPGLGAGGSGGSHSIYQEVKGLREFGIPAQIALAASAMDRARSVYADADEVFVPFADLEALSRVTATADVISATHNKSVEMLGELVSRRSDFLPAYYVQDYEPFFTQDDVDLREAVDSYTAVEGMLLFAKTHWLGNIVGERHGLHVAKVEPSIDADVFHPGAELRAGPLRLAAMVRPRTPRRQPSSTVQVLEQLALAYPDHLEIRVFGCGDDDLRGLTDSPALLQGNRGLISRERVAELLRQSDVFLDMSMYQAFGRTALEAMACGATAIVPAVGGAHEFARDGENALVVDTSDRAAVFAAVSGLIADPNRVATLRAAARETGSSYSVARAALSEYVVFREAYTRRFGRRPGRWAVSR